MILADIGMLAVSSNRTKYYLYQMAKHNLFPSIVLYMEDSYVTTVEQQVTSACTERKPSYLHGIDLNISVLDLLTDLKVSYEHIPSIDPNSKLVVEAVSRCDPSVLLYSGPGGAILRDEVLNTGKRFLHIHSGYLPYYRGSTTIYYSLLNEGNCGATAFFLDKSIDMGPIIMKKKYPPPENTETIDLYYDPFIRSELLIEVLKEYVRRGELPCEMQDINAGETYFIIHPVLKHVAILSSRKRYKEIQVQ